MKIGLVVDGVSEYSALPYVLNRLAPLTGHQYLRVIKADIQPLAPLPSIARVCKPAVAQLAARGADRILVLLDREQQEACAPTLASDLGLVLSTSGCPATVIYKDRTFENWLLGDVNAIRAHPARFNIAPGQIRQIQPDRVDRVDGLAMLRLIARRGYDKVGDSRVILESAQPAQIGLHSRSFRKFLREVGDPTYAAQSRVP
jgi:hypothetical protein